MQQPEWDELAREVSDLRARVQRLEEFVGTPDSHQSRDCQGAVSPRHRSLTVAALMDRARQKP
jgi:hypothetical protein